MSYNITKDLAVNFPNGVDAGELHVDVEKQMLTSAVLEAITVDTDNNECIARFDVEPSAADKATYDSVVANYSLVSHYVDTALNLVINEHFMISKITSDEIASYNWTKTLIGANAEINKKTFPGRPGNVQLVTGQELNSCTAIHIGSQAEGYSFETGTFNQIECETSFTLEDTLSSADFDYFLIGFSDQNDAYGLPLNVAAVYFDPSESPNIQMKTIVNGTQTSIVTSVPVVLGAWYNIKIRYYDLAVNPTMNIEVNGNLEGSVNFAMPLVSTPFSPTIKIDGKNGSSLAKLSVDYFLMKEDYNYN